MQRRRFLTAASTAALTPLANVAKGNPPKPKRPSRRRCRGVVMQIRAPKGFQPKSWRDVPDGAFEVQFTLGPHSLAECRAIVKSANQGGEDGRFAAVVHRLLH